MGIKSSRYVNDCWWEDTSSDDPDPEIYSMWFLIRSVKHLDDKIGTDGDKPTWALLLKMRGNDGDIYALVQQNPAGCICCEVNTQRLFKQLDLVFGYGPVYVYYLGEPSTSNSSWRRFRSTLNPFPKIRTDSYTVAKGWYQQLTNKPFLLSLSEIIRDHSPPSKVKKDRGIPKGIPTTSHLRWDDIKISPESKEEKDVTVVECWVALRTLPDAVGANHWATIVRCSNGQYACIQKDSIGCVSLCLRNDLKEAALSTWGKSEDRVRLAHYGSCNKSWCDFRKWLRPYSVYKLGPDDCQNHARDVIGYLNDKYVGWWPGENGPEFHSV